MTAPELLRAAAERITEDTWCQRELADGRGRYCVLGHLQQAMGLWPHRVYGAAVASLFARVGRVDIWNDRRRQTAVNVRDTLIATADRLESAR